jgi:hypothetical protein
MTEVIFHPQLTKLDVLVLQNLEADIKDFQATSNGDANGKSVPNGHQNGNGKRVLNGNGRLPGDPMLNGNGGVNGKGVNVPHVEGE